MTHDAGRDAHLMMVSLGPSLWPNWDLSAELQVRICPWTERCPRSLSEVYLFLSDANGVSVQASLRRTTSSVRSLKALDRTGALHDILIASSVSAGGDAVNCCEYRDIVLWVCWFSACCGVDDLEGGDSIFLVTCRRCCSSDDVPTKHCSHQYVAACSWRDGVYGTFVILVGTLVGVPMSMSFSFF